MVHIFCLHSAKFLKMNRILVLLTVVVLFMSCGIQRQLHKAFIGKPVSGVKEKLGEPKAVLDQGNEKVYVYEVLKELESTEVSQGKLTLDPMISPKVNKTERYYITVKDGVAAQQTVSLGTELSGLVVVNSGLEAGDTLVTLGQDYLEDGSKVNITAINEGI